MNTQQNIDQFKLRNDMMFFYGQLQALNFINFHDKRTSELLEHMCAQFESFLKVIFDYKDE